MQTGIEVTVNDRIAADVAIEVSDLPQTVTVTAEAAMLTYVTSTHRNWLTPKSEAINFATPSPVTKRLALTMQQ